MALGAINHLRMIPQSPSAAQLLALLQAAIQSVPKLEYGVALTSEEVRWLGRTDALIEASGAMAALIEFRRARDKLGTYGHSRSDILIPLHSAYGRLELQVPEAAQGAFIPGGDTWNGYAALVRLFQRNCDQLLVVDPYLNASLFIDLAPHLAAVSGLRGLTSRRAETHSSLVAAANRWARDSSVADKSVEIRYAPSAALHDRLVIVDDSEVWLISQSLKDIAKRSPASVTRAEPELAQMKAQHYRSLWDSAQLLDLNHD